MLVVEHLLEREEITEGVIERTLDHTLGGIPSYNRHRKCPSVPVESCGILHHGAQHVVGVGIGYVSFPARGIFGCVGGVVARSAEVAESVARRGETDVGGAVAECGGCHSAEHRVIEAAAHCVVVAETVHVASLPVLFITAESEAGYREVVVGSLVIDVVGGSLDGADALAETLVIEHLLLVEEKRLGVCGGLVERGRSQSDVPEIPDHSVMDVDIDVGVFIS